MFPPSPPPQKKKKKCSGHDTKLYLESVEYLFIAITLKFTLTQSDSVC